MYKMFNWLHIINSKNDYKKLWETIFNTRDLHLGRFIIMNGSLSCKDGRIFGNEGDKLAGITTYTYETESMEKMINSGAIDSSTVVLIKDLSTKELNSDQNISKMIKKEIREFDGPTAFKNHLRSIHYKDFKF